MRDQEAGQPGERELIRLLTAGDEYAFEQLYRIYSVPVLKKLVSLVKDEEIAKELLQDIFLKVWQKRGELDASLSFRGFLFRIAENKVIDVLRRAACDRKLLAHITRIATAGENSTETFVQFREVNEALQRAISSLPPQRKKVFVLCKLEGKTYEEVAQLLGISPGTVNDHVVKATRTIKHNVAGNDLAVLLLTTLALATH